MAITKQHIVNYLKEIKPLLTEKYCISRIGLFRSYSTGSEVPDSDIDILIEFMNDDVDVYLAKEETRKLVAQKFKRKVDVAI